MSNLLDITQRDNVRSHVDNITNLLVHHMYVHSRCVEKRLKRRNKAKRDLIWGHSRYLCMSGLEWQVVLQCVDNEEMARKGRKL